MLTLSDAAAFLAFALKHCVHLEKHLKVGDKRWLLFKDVMTQSDGRALCQARGGELLTLNNADEQELLYQAYAGSTYDVWVGLEAKPGTVPSINQQDYLWLSTGLPSVTPDYNGWRKGEPNNFNGNEGKCGLLWLEFGGEFNDAPCQHKKPVACGLGE